MAREDWDGMVGCTAWEDGKRRNAERIHQNSNSEQTKEHLIAPAPGEEVENERNPP
jgi:hypothetical protein